MCSYISEYSLLSLYVACMPLPGLDRQLVGLSLGKTISNPVLGIHSISESRFLEYLLFQSFHFLHSRKGAWTTPGCFGQAYYGTDTQDMSQA